MTPRAALQEALSLASRGNVQEALKRLDNALEDARVRQDNQWIGLLARNAAIVADEAGDLIKAEAYCRVALALDDGDALAHFAFADVERRAGKEEVAVHHFSRCLDLATATNDQPTLELLAKIGIRRPG